MTDAATKEEWRFVERPRGEMLVRVSIRAGTQAQAVCRAFGYVSIPPAITVMALVDPGTSWPILSPEMIRAIDAPRTADGVILVNGSSHHSAHWVDLRIEGTDHREIDVPDVKVLAGDIGFGSQLRPYEMIIGWSVLKHCSLGVNGPMGVFQLVG